MPQKKNPVAATEALAAARLAIAQVPMVLGAMAQEHERAAGAWQSEWAAIPDLFVYTAGAVDRVRSALDSLQVDQRRMTANLDSSSMAESLSMALAPALGRPEAQRVVQRLIAAGDLFDVARADEQVRSVLTDDELERALDARAYLGCNDAFIERALATWAVQATEG